MGIGGQEPAQRGVIQPPIHMNNPQFIEMLMPGVAVMGA